MNLGVFLSYCLVAVFAVNPIFSGVTGIDSILDAMKKPKRLLVLICSVASFSLAGSLLMYPIDLNLMGESPAMIVRGLIFSCIMLFLFFISTKVVRAVSTEFYEKYGDLLAPAALNGAAIGVPLIIAYNKYLGFANVSFLEIEDFPPFAAAVAIGIGSGIAYAIAAFLIKEGLKIANNPDLSDGMKGAPIMMIYIGVLSMAFCSVFGNIALFGSSI